MAARALRKEGILWVNEHYSNSSFYGETDSRPTR